MATQKSLKTKDSQLKTLSAFTLVELIVVIVILAILATIAFLSFSNQSAGARDSTRLANLSNLAKGLSVFQTTSGTYPMPENPVNINASGAIIGYQGFAKDQIGNMVKLTPGGTRDPSDSSIYTTYSVNSSKTKMQLMSFLEDGSSVSGYNFGLYSNAIASSTTDYSKRIPVTKGDTLGILLGNSGATLNQPVQELYIAGSFTGVDVVGTSTEYIAYFNKGNIIIGSGASLGISLDFRINPVRSCNNILKNGLSKGDGIYSINPTGTGAFDAYCDMTINGGGLTLLSYFPAGFPVNDSTDDIAPLRTLNTIDSLVNYNFNTTYIGESSKYFDSKNIYLRIEKGSVKTSTLLYTKDGLNTNTSFFAHLTENQLNSRLCAKNGEPYFQNYANCSTFVGHGFGWNANAGNNHLTVGTGGWGAFWTVGVKGIKSVKAYDEAHHINDVALNTIKSMSFWYK